MKIYREIFLKSTIHLAARGRRCGRRDLHYRHAGSSDAARGHSRGDAQPQDLWSVGLVAPQWFPSPGPNPHPPARQGGHPTTEPPVKSLGRS